MKGLQAPSFTIKLYSRQSPELSFINTSPAVFLPMDDDYEPFPGVPGHPRITDIAFDPFDPKKETPFEFLDRVNAWVAAMGYTGKN
jgi:hypothetical protein